MTIPPRSKIQNKNKLRISPSLLKQAFRCQYAASLRIMPDENGERHKPYFSDQSQNSRHHGIYFEAVLTGKDVSHEKAAFQMWLARNSKDDENVKSRIEKAAERTAKEYLLKDRDYQTGVWLEWEFDDFILHGEADYIGWVRNADPFHEAVFESVMDAKLTADISYVWEIGGNATIEQYMQAPIYSFLHALKESSQPELLLDAIRAYKVGDYGLCLNLSEQFGRTTTILPASYLIYEQKGLPQGVKPNVAFQTITCSPEDFVVIYMTILAMKEDYWDPLRMYGNRYSPQKEHMVQPNEHKCLGHGRLLEQKGRCPFLGYCPYGRKLLTSRPSIALRDLLEEYSPIYRFK